MAIVSDAQIAAYAYQAGFRGEALVTMIATAIAESRGETGARGDTSLQTGTWGPSVGLTQIRSLNAERGTGSTRDEIANLDPATNLRHAYEISGGGTNFRPWSMFTNGRYREHLDRARSAATAALAGGGIAGIQGGIDLGSIPGLPPGVGVALGELGDEAKEQVAAFFGAAVEPFVTGLRRLSLLGIAVAGGLVLIIAGAARTVSPPGVGLGPGLGGGTSS